MTIQAVPPSHPFPQPPQPQQPPVPHIQTPMVYVYEKQQWEYRIIASAMTQEDLNSLGAEGWELVSVVAQPATTQFYFKRLRA
jgi:hypothetical protein